MIVDRVNAIQKENRILLKKMLTIDLKPGKYNPQRIKMFPAPSSYSLNRNKRIRELTRVTQENKMLLQRLQSAQSVYDRNKIPAPKFPLPHFRASNEPRIMSAVGGRRFGYSTMPLKARRAKSSYAVARRNRKKKRIMTAGHGGRKRSAAKPQLNRPITAKGPIIGRRQRSNIPEENEGNDFRQNTVPFSNVGFLGPTEPQDGDEKIQQEINREVTGESEKDIEDRIGEEGENSSKSVDEENQPKEDKFNEQEKQLENLTDDLSNNQDKNKSDGGAKNQTNEEENEEKHDLKNKKIQQEESEKLDSNQQNKVDIVVDGTHKEDPEKQNSTEILKED